MGTIIIIDEAQELRTALTNILSGRGHAVHSFATGRLFAEALAARTVPVDAELAIVDVATPEAVGIEAIRTIKLRHPGAKILALAETGRFGTSESQRLLAQAVGAQSVLVKPFTAQELAAAIQQLLGVY